MLLNQDIRGRGVDDVRELLIQTEFKSRHGLRGESESDRAVLFCNPAHGVGEIFTKKQTLLLAGEGEN